MRVFRYELTQDGEEAVPMTVTVETDRGGSFGFARDEARDIMTSAPESKGELRLRPDQRVVITSRVEEPVHDRVQNAAVMQSAQAAEPLGEADEPSLDLPHPDNNEAIAAEAARLTREAEINKTAPPDFGPPPKPTRQVETSKAVTPSTPAAQVVRETREVRTPATGAAVQGRPNPDARKPSVDDNVNVRREGEGPSRK